jgi:membrane-associated phospholipid phosphatase
MPGEDQAPGSPRRVQRIVVLLSVGAGLVVAALVLGLFVVGRRGGGPIQGWDDNVQEWGVHHRLGLVGASKVVAFVGDAPVLGIVVVLFTVVLLLVTRSIRSFIPLVAYAGGEALVFVVRVVVHRPRPPTADFPAPGAVPGVHETSYAFPSGHSVAMTAVLFAVLGSVALARRWIWPWIIASVASLFVIDTRLVLSVHWFSDAVFGLIIGAAWGTAVALVFEGLSWDDLKARRPDQGRRGSPATDVPATDVPATDSAGSSSDPVRPASRTGPARS